MIDMNPPSTNLAAAANVVPAAVLISRVARVVRQRLESALAPRGLNQRQLVALSYLREHGPTPQRALAQQLCMDASSLVFLLNQLEDAEMILRTRDRTDRRRGILELSANGEQVLDEIDQMLRSIDDDVLTGLRRDERETLRDLLARLNAGMPDWGAAIAESP
jgi:DNA-binding MarR family transcriptional regulator